MIAMKCVPAILFLHSMFLCGSPLGVQFRKHNISYEGGDDPGDPLYLTPYLQSGQIQEAQTLSKSNFMNRTSYAGFFTVNETSNSNMYFWFFPSMDGNSSTPVLLWLQGGPGGSSLYGLFIENGPFLVDKDGKIEPRPWSWNSKYHMLYIDNPVGTGYSFTVGQIPGYSTNEVEVADNLYSCLEQFFTLLPKYQANDFYLTGESYAGKYIPAIGYKIHTANQNSPKIVINLRGMAIGDGLCDPENMVGGYGDLLFQFGLVDEMQKAFFDKETATAISYIKNKDFYAAFKIFDMLLNGDLSPYPTFFYNATGSTNYYNILRQEEPAEYSYYINYINQAAIRKLMKVGKLPYGAQSESVEKAIVLDIMDTVKDWLAVLMENYKVLLYNGQLDIIVGAPLTERYLQVLEWSHKSDYLKAEKQVWKLGADVAGYVRKVNNFYQVVVRGAGHILPFDQPERAFELIDQFISGRLMTN